MVAPYNPLDKMHLGESIRDALLKQPVHPLQLEKFQGAGVYAIYYVGPFLLYESVAKRNVNGKFEAPIYVGEAVPAGYMKGGLDLSPVPKPTNKLYERLRDHAKSIREAENLELTDFYCRYLVVDDIWIPLG